VKLGGVSLDCIQSHSCTARSGLYISGRGVLLRVRERIGETSTDGRASGGSREEGPTWTVSCWTLPGGVGKGSGPLAVGECSLSSVSRPVWSGWDVSSSQVLSSSLVWSS
jgi:hypothetical protein